MMFDLNYQDRLTWLKTIIVFDTTRNKYLNPFLGKRFSNRRMGRFIEFLSWLFLLPERSYKNAYKVNVTISAQQMTVQYFTLNHPI